MLSIDLLKGQGIPIKSRPGGAAFVTIIIAVPVIIAVVMLGNYVRGTIVVSTNKRILKNYEADIADFSKNIEFQQNAKSRIENMKACLGEVSDIMKQQIQWSEILEDLAKSLPHHLVLSELNLRLESVNKEVPRRDDPEKKITIPVPKCVLSINFYGKRMSNSDQDALEFLQSLRAAEALKAKVESIRMLSQHEDPKDDTVHYEIECEFKS